MLLTKASFDRKPWVFDEPFGVVGADADIRIEPADTTAECFAVDCVHIQAELGAFNHPVC